MKYFPIILLLIPFFMVSCSDPKSGSEQIIKVEPNNEILFSTTYIGDFEDQEVIISNVGNGKLDVTKLEILYSFKSGSLEPESNEFTIVNSPDLPFTLKERESKTITVRYTPSVTAKYDEIALNIHNSTEISKVSLEIKVAELKPIISVQPNTVVFAGVSVGSEESEVIIIKNIGTANLVIKKDDIKLAAAPSVTLIPFEDSKIANNTNIEDIVICPKNTPEINGCKELFKFKVKYIAVSEDQSNGGIRIKSNSSKTNTSEVIVPIITSSSECVLSLYPQESIIDMGNRRIDASASKTLVLKNSGQADCNISNIRLFENDENVFELKDLPDFPKIMESGQRVNFNVEFTPTAEVSYSGKFEIIANDPTWVDGKKEFALIGAGRYANGPVAVCKIVESNSDYAEVEPAIDNERLVNNSIITLDGRGSYDTSSPEAGVSYQWSKISGPEGSTTQPRTPTQGQSKYFVDVTGSHKLKLTVTNQDGETDSCEVEAYGLSANSLHIELFWDVASDVDLHLRVPNGDDNDWNTSKDCYFGNCTTGGSGAGMPCQAGVCLNGGTCENGICTAGESNPDGLEWGLPGADDNPKLDRDDVSGTGPENINLKAPFDSQGAVYTVAAHYYGASENSNGTNATIKVYCNGDMQYSGTQKLEDTNWFWYAANINWIGDGVDGTCEVTAINNVIDHKP